MLRENVLYLFKYINLILCYIGSLGLDQMGKSHSGPRYVLKNVPMVITSLCIVILNKQMVIGSQHFSKFHNEISCTFNVLILAKKKNSYEISKRLLDSNIKTMVYIDRI